MPHSIRCRWAHPIALLLVLLLTGCTAVPSAAQHTDSGSATRELFAMDTYMTLTAYGERAEEALDACEEEIQRLDALWSVGSEESETSRLNREGGGTLSPETAALAEQSLSLYESTGGAFDITIYPLMEAWGFTSGNYRVPDEGTLNSLLEKVDAGALVCDAESRRLTLPEGVQVDFGGIAKGYASQRMMELFEEYGCTSGVVSLGGNAQTFRTKPDGSLWRVGIENPDSSVLPQTDFVGVLSTADEAVITSGGYERFFEENGQSYHHILDPATGYPARSGLISVTIVSDSGALADGLSTALFVMGKDRALDYWRAHREEFDAVLVEEDGSITVTAGLEERFSSDAAYQIVQESKEGNR